MTVEGRAREAATAIHAAVARVEPRPLRTRRRRWLMRATVGVILAGLTPPAGVTVINAAREGAAETDVVVDGPRTPDGGATTRHHPVGESQTQPPPQELTTDDPAQEPAEQQPSPQRSAGSPAEPTVTPKAEQAEPGQAADAFSNCIPLIEDRRGDVDNAAIDILESSTIYDASRNTLVIRHVIDDIPATAPFPNEALAYEYYFTIDGTWYMAMSYIGPASFGSWHFSVQRDDRTRTDEWPNVPRQTVMEATGRVDTTADTVEIEIDIDEFNRGERRVSADEGLPPAAELKRGSRLTSIRLMSYPRSAGAGPYDEAHGCDYIVEEPG